MAVLVCGLMSSAVHAEDVFVTEHGKKYHKADSRFLKGKETIKMTREEAEAEGYLPARDFLESETDAGQDSTPKKVKKSAKKSAE